MKPWMGIALVVPALSLGLGGACGGGFAGDDDDDINFPDANAPYCVMQAEVTPFAPEAPETIVVTATITKVGGLSGLETFDWSVRFGGAEVPFMETAADGHRIQFEADAAGTYPLELNGAVGGESCSVYTTSINVRDPNANENTYRLVLVPRPSQPAPPQVQTVTIPGGANFDIGDRDLASGLAITGTLEGPAATAITGYLRATHNDPVLAIPREAFAGAGGAYQLRLTAGDYDVLVIPTDNAIAPVRYLAVAAAGLTGTLTVPAADTITGTVLRDDGSPIEGARVALTIAGVPSSIATTDATGAFSVAARAGGATALTVVPPDGSLPQLELAAASGLVAAPGTPIAIRYAAGTGARTESFTVVATDGSTPTPGATVDFLARSVAAAGTVTPEGGSAFAATGSARVTATADGAGAIGPLQLLPAVYDVVATPPLGSAAGEAPQMLALDLTTGTPAPASIGLAAPATVRAAIDATAVGDRVTAVPRGVLAAAQSATVESTVTSPGRIELELVGGGAYDMIVRSHPPLHIPVTAPASGAEVDLEAISVPDSIVITGRVQSVDIAGGVSGVTVMLLCEDCAGPDALVPVAETVSGAGGAFSLYVPDPGTTE
jgi:hypothetical protein